MRLCEEFPGILSPQPGQTIYLPGDQLAGPELELQLSEARRVLAALESGKGRELGAVLTPTESCQAKTDKGE
jgi:hypothetical protein